MFRVFAGLTVGATADSYRSACEFLQKTSHSFWELIGSSQANPFWSIEDPAKDKAVPLIKVYINVYLDILG